MMNGNANPYHLTMEDRMRWAQISDVIKNISAVKYIAFGLLLQKWSYLQAVCSFTLQFGSPPLNHHIINNTNWDRGNKFWLNFYKFLKGNHRLFSRIMRISGIKLHLISITCIMINTTYTGVSNWLIKRLSLELFT